MEALDTASRPSVGLPSISSLDSIKREEGDYHRKHSTATMVSPLHPYPGPSFSHSNHQSPIASAVPGPLGGLLSPPESRRTSGDEKEQQRVPARQSLPSIHEALGGSDQSLAFSAPPPPPSAPASASASQSYFPSPATTSPADQRTRAFSSDFHSSQGPGSHYSQTRSPFMNTSASTAPPPPPPQTQSDSLHRPSYSESRPSFSSEPRSSFSAPQQAQQHNPKLPTLHPIRTTQSPPPGPGRLNPPYSYPSQPPSTYETSAPHSAGPMYPHSNYSQYPSNYPLSAPAPGAPPSTYPPSATTYSAPPRGYPGAPVWGQEGRLEEKKMNRSSLNTYGESVKRHLESFDLEASLNEIADGSGRISDFSKIYRQRAHDNQRIGLTPQSMPRLDEVDEMLKQSDRIVMSLQRMREVVFNHHQASMVEAPQDPRYRQINGYDHDAASNYGEDGKGGGGFGGPDNKRKRGRAAPPGRCHSCNRAETPEWRRGPDGARTLCNACGLHYAKLTRKMGGKQAMASSNLRPKSLDQGSPTA